MSDSLIFVLLLMAVQGVGNAQVPRMSTQSLRASQPRPTSEDVTKSQVTTKLAELPLGFEPNKGQVDPEVKYVAHGGQYTLFLTSSEVVFALPVHIDLPINPKSIISPAGGRESAKPSTWTSIAMRLIGARSTPAFSANDQLPGKKNYYIGRDRAKWALGVPLYSRVHAQDVYPGIDMGFRSMGKGFEFNFVVNPGADSGQIKLAFGGVRHIQINPSGELVVSSAAGDLQVHRPVAYQDMPGGTRRLVDVRFARAGNSKIRLALGPYDRSRQLVIDPSVTYATYLGGQGSDLGLGVATDDSGNTYVTGATNSPNFPVKGQGGFNYAGGFDVFVTELDPNGQLVFSDLVGGSNDDVGTSIAVGSGGIYVTGYSKSDDFPASLSFCGATNSCPYLTGFPLMCGTQSVIVFFIDSQGDFQLNSSTYLGGSNIDTGMAITLDTAYGEGSSYLYVAGQTTSTDFPTCYPMFNGTQLNGTSDAFVAKISQTFSEVWFTSYLGGSKQDFASGIAIDKPSSTESNIYVTGGTNSPDFYTTPGAFQTKCGTDGNCNGGQDDAFVTVLCAYRQSPCSDHILNPNYVYSTFLGGSGKDDASSIAADTTGNAYLTGQTSSHDFPTVNPFQPKLNGTQNAFVSKLNPAGNDLVFSTYLGGSHSDAGLGVAIDEMGNDIYVTGRTNSPDFPTTENATQSKIGGGNDAFISVLDSSGSGLNFSTFLGGSGDEDVVGGSIAVDSTQNVYVTGDTNSGNFPTQNAFQNTIGSTQVCFSGVQTALCPDAFVAKLNVPSANSFILTVTVDGGPSGALGSVTSDPPGIDCSDNPNDQGTCVANFQAGEVTLTANPVNDQFAGWGGDAPPSCGMNLTCQIQLASNMTVTATFNPVAQLYTLSVEGGGVSGSSPGTGTITSLPAGINCGTGGQVCQFDFAGGTQVSLTATPDPGSFFYGWSGNPACSGTGQCVIVMSSNQSVTYVFLANNAPPPQPDFTITITPQSLGVVPVGTQGVAGIVIATLNGFTDTVNMSCSVMPASASSPSCAVTPSSLNIPLNGAGSATLTVNTTGIAAGKIRHAASATLAFWLPFLGALFGGAKFPGSRGARGWLSLLLGAILLGVMSLQVACGGSGHSVPVGGLASPGNYTVVVNAQGATTLISHSVQVTVTVQ